MKLWSEPYEMKGNQMMTLNKKEWKDDKSGNKQVH